MAYVSLTIQNKKNLPYLNDFFFFAFRKENSILHPSALFFHRGQIQWHDWKELRGKQSKRKRADEEEEVLIFTVSDFTGKYCLILFVAFANTYTNTTVDNGFIYKIDTFHTVSRVATSMKDLRKVVRKSVSFHSLC